MMTNRISSLAVAIVVVALVGVEYCLNAGGGGLWALVEAIEHSGWVQSSRGLTLWQEHMLYTGQSMSIDKGVSLTMQNDCNLVLYPTGRSESKWSSKTGDGTQGCYLKMQTDGNLVVYDPNGPSPKWSSESAKDDQIPGPYFMTVQYDGNMVIYAKGQNAIWSTQTNND